MTTEIKVTVIRQSDRDNYILRYRDPMTGKRKFKSTDTSKRSEAVKAAGKWEAELREGRYAAPLKTTWAGFRERYEADVLPGLALRTRQKVSAVFNVFEEILSPQRLASVTADRLSFYQSKLREFGRSESTIKGNLSHLKAALKWGQRVGLLTKMPTIEMPRRAKGQKMMKGRPITGEEFDRMIAAVPKVVLFQEGAPKFGRKRRAPKPPTPQRQAREAAVIASWEHYLRGLWWSGLRLAESLDLWWDRDDRLCIDLSDRRPTLRIPAALEKGNQDRTLAIAPEFAEFLLSTPEAERHGPVFNPMPKRVGDVRLVAHSVGETVCAIGKHAGIKVNTDQAGKVKYASAHDLRRSFGERWARAPGVTPQVLMELMRHESIETTMRFYVGKNAQATADVLWAAVAQKSGSGNTNGNSGQSSGPEAPADNSPNSTAATI